MTEETKKKKAKQATGEDIGNRLRLRRHQEELPHSRAEKQRVEHLTPRTVVNEKTVTIIIHQRENEGHHPSTSSYLILLTKMFFRIDI